jgi:hypothetical protein
MPLAPRTKWRDLVEQLWNLPPSVRVADIAWKAGLRRPHAYKILRGMLVPNRTVSMRLAKALGIAHGEFVRRLERAVQSYTALRRESQKTSRENQQQRAGSH